MKEPIERLVLFNDGFELLQVSLGLFIIRVDLGEFGGDLILVTNYLAAAQGDMFHLLPRFLFLIAYNMNVVPWDIVGSKPLGHK